MLLMAVFRFARDVSSNWQVTRLVMTVSNITTTTDVNSIVANTINMLYTHFFKAISSSGFPRPLFRLDKPCLLPLAELVFPSRTSGDYNWTQQHLDNEDNFHDNLIPSRLPFPTLLLLFHLLDEHQAFFPQAPRSSSFSSLCNRSSWT